MAMRVLFATDGSDRASRAGQWLASLPWETRPEIDIVTVIPERIAYRGPARPGWRPDWAKLERVREEEGRSAAALVSGAAALFAGWEPPQEFVRRGHAATEIARLAKEREADWVAIATRGRHATGRFAMGGVSQAVLRQAPCSVLVVGPNAGPPSTLLVATDLSEHADRSVEAAAGLPMPAGARAVLLHVLEEHPLLYDLAAPVADEVRRTLDQMRQTQEETVKALLRRAEGQLQARGWETRLEVRSGEVADQIVAAAQEDEADWIVLGARGLSSAPDLPLGAAAQKVGSWNPGALLVVRR
jgi:nucleotide-binding universal stress UspA family protein